MHREERDEKDMRRHSSHLDIVDYSGNMIERLYFDAEGNELPKNKSFDYLREEDIRERVIDDHGRRRVVRDVKHQEHMEMAESDGGIFLKYLLIIQRKIHFKRQVILIYLCTDMTFV